MEMFVQRWHGFDSLAVVVREVPEKTNYHNWQDVSLLPFALIPRFLVPWKPKSTALSIFSFKVYRGGAAVSPFPIAEGYFNFGGLGVILLMSSLGLIQRWFPALHDRDRELRDGGWGDMVTL